MMNRNVNKIDSENGVFPSSKANIEQGSTTAFEHLFNGTSTKPTGSTGAINGVSSITTPNQLDWVDMIEMITTEFTDNKYKVLFPLSPKPWNEPVAHGYPIASACPPEAIPLLPNTGLLVEANCINKIAEVERAVRVAEAEVYRLRAKENLLKAHLFQIQAAMEGRLLQISDNLIGHTHSELERIAEHQRQSQNFDNHRNLRPQANVGTA